MLVDGRRGASRKVSSFFPSPWIGGGAMWPWIESLLSNDFGSLKCILLLVYIFSLPPDSELAIRIHALGYKSIAGRCCCILCIYCAMTIIP